MRKFKSGARKEIRYLYTRGSKDARAQGEEVRRTLLMMTMMMAGAQNSVTRRPAERARRENSGDISTRVLWCQSAALWPQELGHGNNHLLRRGGSVVCVNRLYLIRILWTPSRLASKLLIITIKFGNKTDANIGVQLTRSLELGVPNQKNLFMWHWLSLLFLSN